MCTCVLPDSRSRPSHGSASRSANGAEFSLNTTGPPIQRESEWATTSAKLVKNCRGHSLHQTMLQEKQRVKKTITRHGKKKRAMTLGKISRFAVSMCFNFIFSPVKPQSKGSLLSKLEYMVPTSPLEQSLLHSMS
jgi:hypothetical protein